MFLFLPWFFVVGLVFPVLCLASMAKVAQVEKGLLHQDTGEDLKRF